MGLDEDAWEEYLADVPAARASCEQHTPPAGCSSTAGHSDNTAARTVPAVLCLGVDYVKMLIAEGEGCEAVLVLERLLRMAERQNPLHMGAGSPPLTGAQLNIILHKAPPIQSVENGEGFEYVESREKSAYRVWCAKRVAAGELSILQNSLTVVAALRQAVEEAQLDDSEGSEQSGSETESPTLKRQKL